MGGAEKDQAQPGRPDDSVGASLRSEFLEHGIQVELDGVL